MGVTTVKTTFIYALCEPGSRIIRYIGQTKNLEERFYSHIKTSSTKKTHLGNWLRSLSEPPVLVVLHEVSENESWAEEERRYISCAHAIGIDLVNATEGGEGHSGPHSPEHCAAISASMRGVKTGPCSPKRRAAISASKIGVPLSLEQCAAMSAARRGVPRGPYPPERCAAMRAAVEGVQKSDDHKSAISASVKAYHSRNNISRDNW